MKYCFFYTLLFFVAACQQLSNDSPNNRLEQKHKPSEILFLQKAYPDTVFNLEKYTQSLRSVSKALSQDQSTPKSERFAANWVNQGPNNIGGRINTIAINPTNNRHILIGYSVGGVFETRDGGISWQPIFDEQPFTTIGTIEFDPTDPNTIWVGTGDPNISGYPFVGDGIYKSIDGGKTWEHKGLTDTRIISSIQIHPFNNNIIYAATMGIPFERNNDRGVYRSLDGGTTWEQILFIAPDAGAIDLILNPENPNVLYAAGWNRIRNNRESSIVGAAAKVFRTTDGGDRWEVLTGGLPQGDNGRVGIAMSPSNSNRLYAMYVGVNSNLDAIYTSADGGDSWDAVPTDTDTGLPERALGGFGWYFGQLRVHPFNENQIYLLGVELWEYDNQMWRQTTPNWSNYIVHADKHDLVFTTNNQMLLATDGGLYRSTDFGTSWQDIENISATQFYRVAYNPHRPDLYYGGAQDNGTTGGNRKDNINWTRIFGGDGFQTVFHPLDPDVFYLEIQNGRIYVTSNNGEDYEFAMNGIDAMDRRNWDMPYLMNPLNADELFAGTYRVYRSRSGVIPAWEAVSEDLTDGIADRYHTISAMHASPLADGQLIVGTSDANVWLTTDHGDRWQRLDNEQLPNRYVSDVKLSPTETARLYVSYSGYKDGDNRPHIYRSDDAGQQWFSIAGNLPNIAINDIFVLPQQSDSVIFVGTDAGVYATLDGGTDWQRLGNNMPIIPIYDMTWNEARHQLVVGSHARGIYTYPLDSLLQDVVSSYVFSSEKPVVAAPLDIYPNPAQATVNIEFLNHEIGKSAQLLVFSAAGQLVHRQEIGAATNTTRKHLRLDVNNWTPGTYHVHLKIRHQILSGQFLVVQ